MSSTDMVADSLFSTERRPARRRDRWTQTDYERLDQAVGEVPEQVRRLLDRWYLELPAHARGEIHQRFAEPSIGAHLGAFWELYLHETARRLGFDVEVNIGLDHDRRRPDLLLSSDPRALFIEATVVLGDGAVASDQRARADQLYAAIDRVSNRDFLLYTDLERVGESTPGARTVTGPLDRWLDTLNADAVRQHTDAGGTAPALLIDKDGWRVRIEATGILPELRGNPDAGVIGSRGEGADDEGEGLMRTLDDITPLTRVLRKKAGHGYELADRSFVIAVLCAGDFVDDHDIAQALFGRIEYRVSMRSDRATGRCLPGGLWHDGRGPRNRHVSAVLTASNLTLGGIAAVEPCLWLNPAASHPIEPTTMPWRRREISSTGQPIEHAPTSCAADVFGLPPRWPIAG